MNDESVIKYCDQCEELIEYCECESLEAGSELDTDSERTYHNHPVDELTAKMLKTLDDALMIGMDRDSDEA